MAEFKNPLSRSISKSTVLHYCVKKYYFSTYSNYLKEVDMWLRNDAMVSKNIKSLAMWLGECLHDLMSDYLHLIKDNQNSAENIEKAKVSLVTKMDRDFQISKVRDYTKYNSDLKFWLTEHYYKENIDDMYLQWKKSILDCFDAFCKSELNDEIISYIKDPENTIFIEPNEKNFESMKIEIDNNPDLMWMNIYAQPDFWIITKDKKYIIYDRKSGKIPEKDPNSISDQLKVYAYKVLQKIWLENIDNIDVQAYEIFLKWIVKFGWKITKQDLLDIEQKIVDDANIQKQLIINKNVESNMPLESSAFHRTDDPYKCQNCTFYKVCEEIKKYEKFSGMDEIQTPKIEEVEYSDDDFPF